MTPVRAVSSSRFDSRNDFFRFVALWTTAWLRREVRKTQTEPTRPCGEHAKTLLKEGIEFWCFGFADLLAASMPVFEWKNSSLKHCDSPVLTDAEGCSLSWTGAGLMQTKQSSHRQFLRWFDRERGITCKQTSLPYGTRTRKKQIQEKKETV